MIAPLVVAAALAESLAQEPRGSAPAVVEVAPSRAATAEAQDGFERALTWLLENQNEDGTWGHWRNPDSEYWSNLETHKSWQVATTGLGVMALLDARADPTRSAEWRALLDGLDFLVAHAETQRPSDWDVDNTWAYQYGLAALTQAARDERFAGEEHAERRAAMKAMGERLLTRLWDYQTPTGGWAYYADESLARRPWWGTSFNTAIVVLALLEAQELGWAVDEERLARAIAAVEGCRLPNGAYTYSIELFPSPGGLEHIDQVKGSLSRIQVCNLALYRAGQRGHEVSVELDELREGLRLFFRHHRFLDVARRKPIPHEAYYDNSGYFYFFGHYYAAGVIETLPESERADWFQRLDREVLKTQRGDGSMWDYVMHDFGKPYGVAYGLSCLARSTSTARSAPAPAGTR